MRAFADGKSFVRSVLRVAWSFALPSLVLVLFFLLLLPDLTSGQWRDLALGAGLYTLLASPLQQWIHRREMGRVPAYLDQSARGEPDAETLQQAYRDLLDLPRRSARLAVAGWVAPVLLIALFLGLRWGEQSISSSGARPVAG